MKIKTLGFPGSSASRESACNAGGPGLIPGSGRSPGEGIGYPLQYSRAFLWLRWSVWALGWVDPLEEGMAIRSSILAWRMSMDRGACSTWCCKGLDVTEWLSTHNKNIYWNIYYTPCIPATVKPLGWQTHGLTKHHTGLFYVVKIVFWMELKMIILNEASQTETKYHMISLVCGI